MNDTDAEAGLTITPLADRPGVAIGGDVDFRSLAEFTDAVAAAIKRHPGDVHIDLGGLTFIEVSGMRVLADAARQLREQNRQLLLENLAPQLRPVLKLVGWYDSAGSAD